jgi:hypothetical protein
LRVTKLFRKKFKVTVGAEDVEWKIATTKDGLEAPKCSVYCWRAQWWEDSEWVGLKVGLLPIDLSVMWIVQKLAI